MGPGERGGKEDIGNILTRDFRKTFAYAQKLVTVRLNQS